MQVATAMNAGRVILTHFSQRYPRFPVGLPVEGGPDYGYHLVAYDGMVVPLNMLEAMPELMPLLTGRPSRKHAMGQAWRHGHQPLSPATCLCLRMVFIVADNVYEL